MNTLELIKDSCLYGGTVPNERTEEVRNFLDNLEKQLTIPVVMHCGTCKHQEVSKYVEPCYGCRDNNGYDNFESAIVL